MIISVTTDLLHICAYECESQHVDIDQKKGTVTGDSRCLIILSDLIANDDTDTDTQ